MTVKVRYVELERAMLNQWASLNIIELSRFGGDCMYIMGFVNLDLIVRLIRAADSFMYLMLRRPTTYCLGILRFIIIKKPLPPHTINV